MLVLPTAKILLFIALNLGPQNPPMIYATSNSESYVWTPTTDGLDGRGKGLSRFRFHPRSVQDGDFDGKPTKDSIPAYLRAISSHQWNHNSAMVFDNGDRVEKHGDHAFYIINAGGANEKVFTILFPTCDKS